MRSFSESGWLADIRGVRRDEEGGGIVCGLPVHSFSTDKRGVATKSSTEVVISDRQEPELSRLGFIPLCHCADTEFSAFYTNQSVQKPRAYDEPAATMNARISAMLQYMLCVSRFAHYLKAIARDKIGTFAGAGGVRGLSPPLAAEVRDSGQRGFGRGQGQASPARGPGAGLRASGQAGELPVHGPSVAALRVGRACRHR